MNTEDQITVYLEKTMDYLSNKEEGWVKEHPEIIERLKTWEWKTDLENVKQALLDTFDKVQETSIDLVALVWDKKNAFLYVKGEGVEEDEEIEDLEDDIDPWDWPEYTLVLDFVDKVFHDMQDWGKVVDEEYELFHRLFYTLVEVATLDLINNKGFQKLDLQKEYAIISFLWGDDNHEVIFDTKREIEYEVYFNY